MEASYTLGSAGTPSRITLSSGGMPAAPPPAYIELALLRRTGAAGPEPERDPGRAGSVEQHPL
ncbi:MAG: hypothetical protein H6647_14430 [Anaerolineales bacterium]|nr:hypothetical protein [Anaerolineales bacterium]